MAGAGEFDLFGAPRAGLPGGLRYAEDVISLDEAARLVEAFADLPFQAFDFHGFKGNRRIVSYGGRYDFSASRLEPTEPIPDFLLPARTAAAAFAGMDPDTIQHAMVTEYAPGAGIGWHRDRPEFDKVIGLSFISPVVLRLRRKEGERWRRASLPLAPRSAYVLDGAARTDWQHSIVPGERLRYSVTFRTLRGSPDA
ncbi:alpha-ketoglutarate-dependent dioxygenase AlkB [Roseibacterium beibuensis]|uniref:alpha-ketoglutarate-dependent dioxygenase AlkB n=1 Tax=[Roseibacterium] beibuensis TaxID=1193142 RepID=UPI00217DA284|nr:alpha-ketoglutarate-dependent dioxygenase AlkB [Roseibacterium beibuensis]MCS6622620.1 alpha-ketoglutarate-dependent dioxygenase AlkB [Roseibacterium beibuensis]